MNCIYCNSNKILSRGDSWNCKECGKYWKKKYKHEKLAIKYGIKLYGSEWGVLGQRLEEMPPSPSDTIEERIFYIWLAGLISSDGCIYYGRHSRRRKGFVFNCVLTSVDKDWLEHVKSKGDIFGLPSNIVGKDKIFLRFSSLHISFYLVYYASDWLMKRKLTNIFKYLETPINDMVYREWKEKF